ncbi:spermidine synthase [Myxococcota bacterium]|nr:spermidine synthase [Myxococcota bacterium]
MTRAWKTLDRVDTAGGRLELRQRAERDFLIIWEGRVLMNSSAHASERALGALAAGLVHGRPRPRVLIGGLGMGFTLRGVLDGLGADARVSVVELEPAVVRWCRGPLALLTETAVADSRVDLEIADVADVVRRIAGAPQAQRFDAIAFDLFEGPEPGRRSEDPLFGDAALERTRRALAPEGVFAVWSEAERSSFGRRLSRAGFDFELRRPGRGGLRHAVYVARHRKPRRRRRSPVSS